MKTGALTIILMIRAVGTAENILASEHTRHFASYDHWDNLPRRNVPIGFVIFPFSYFKVSLGLATLIPVF